MKNEFDMGVVRHCTTFRRRGRAFVTTALYLAGFLALLGAASVAFAQTIWFVDGNNDHDPSEDGSAAHPFNTIQEGVDAALDGDTVLVAEGVYRGTGNKRITMLGKRVTLTSASGPAGCTIDCEHDGRGFDLSHGETAFTSISGFTIVNGRAEHGGGVRLLASSPTISNCVIRGNHATDTGGGVYADWSSVSLRDCLIVGNTASNAGGGASGVVLAGCTILSNAAMNGGGLYNVLASNCLIGANAAADFGGGVNLGTLRNCTVIDNTANNGGGVCDASIWAGLISGNSANYGGGVSYGTLADCTIESNTALHGGGLYNSAASNCIIAANRVHDLSGFGGGANHGVLRNCLVIGNHANNGGGTADGLIQDCQILSNTAAWGGGSAFSTLSNCTLTGNSARDGGGGSAYGVAWNCVIFDNRASSGGGTCNGLFVNCLILSNHAGWGGGSVFSALSNCTLTGNSATGDGGGSAYGSLHDCALRENEASTGGGSAYDALTNCILAANTASVGGGAYHGELNRCSLLGNTAWSQGGGVFGGTLRNCVLMDNESTDDGGGAHSASLGNCTLSSNRSTHDGGGVYSCSLSNCIVFYNDAGDGANHYNAASTHSCTTPDPGGTGNITEEPAFIDYARGNLRLLSNSPCINTGTNQDWMLGAKDMDGNRRVVGRFVDMGAYEFQGTSIFYVAQGNPGALAPYASWASAAARIQDAVDEATDGDIVLVSNGLYAVGVRLSPGGVLSNRLVATNAIMIRSVNGPSVTTIEGSPDPLTGGNGTNAVRCVYLAGHASLAGFTLANGATHSTGSYYGSASCGGAILCESADNLISNCALVGNSAQYGGGAYRGTLVNCVLASNAALIGGGACDSDAIACMVEGNTASYWAGGLYSERIGLIEGCTVKDNHSGNMGGGVQAASSLVKNCAIINNAADDGGGGVAFSSIRDCIVVSNTAIRGGGASWSSLLNCALTDNAAERGGGTFNSSVESCTVVGNRAVHFGGGAAFGSIRNSILIDNTATDGIDNFRDVSMSFCCTTPDPGGAGNITNAPDFVDKEGGDLRLRSTSPCVNAGTNQDWMAGDTDLDGHPRIFGGGRVDMGAYEYPASVSVIPTNWLAQHGLPIDGSDDFGDEDGDAAKNWQEWRCGTDPLNPLSVFVLEDLSTGSGSPMLTWRTVYGRGYWVQKTTDLTLGSWSNLLAFPVFELDEFPEGMESVIDFSASSGAGVQYRVLLEDAP